MSFYFVCFLFFKLFPHTHVVSYKFAYGARHSWKQPDVTSLKISCNILLACNSISVSLPIKYNTYLYIYVYIYYIYSLRNPFPGIVISFFPSLIYYAYARYLGWFHVRRPCVCFYLFPLKSYWSVLLKYALAYLAVCITVRTTLL